MGNEVWCQSRSTECQAGVKGERPCEDCAHALNTLLAVRLLMPSIHFILLDMN